MLQARGSVLLLFPFLLAQVLATHVQVDSASTSLVCFHTYNDLQFRLDCVEEGPQGFYSIEGAPWPLLFGPRLPSFPSTTHNNILIQFIL